MILEKDKIYKIFHNPRGFADPFPRDYLLLCPSDNLVLADDFVKGKEYRKRLKYWQQAKHVSFGCLFIVCFDGKFSFNHESSIFEDSYFEDLNNGDLKEIKDVLLYMSKMGEKYKYNRKLNRVIKL